MATSQSSQKLRKLSSPSSSNKQTGPIRATQSFRLINQHDGSSTVTPKGQTDVPFSVQHAKIRPVIRISSTDRQRAKSPPEYSSYELKDKKVSPSLIHRSSSFDTIISSNYLNGEWPKIDPHGQQQRQQQFGITRHVNEDKETQTPTEWYVPHRRTHRRKAYHERSSSVGGYSDIFQEMKVRLTRPCRDHLSHGIGYPVVGHLNPAAVASRTVKVQTGESGHHSGKHRQAFAHTRGSLEGLNQEIEKLDMNKAGGDHVSDAASFEYSVVNNGRCAPVSDFLVDSADVGSRQFLTTAPEDGRCSSNSDNSSSRLSPPILIASPLFRKKNQDKESPSTIDCERPKPQNILDRKPPDGCEMMEKKFLENSSDAPHRIFIPVAKHAAIKCCIPSTGSAFFAPLCKKYMDQPTDMLTIISTYN